VATANGHNTPQSISKTIFLQITEAKASIRKAYQLSRSAAVQEALGITIEPSAGGHGGTFIPEGIRWVVERSLAWVSRYRRLNTIFERTEAHLVAFIEIAFISILSRRLVRLATSEISV
jgi:hypothetical protein